MATDDTNKKRKKVGEQLGESVKIIDKQLPKITTKHRSEVIAANDRARDIAKKLGTNIENTEPPSRNPVKPKSTKHPKWPGKNPKHDPTPPTDPVFPIPKELATPTRPPAPSKITDPVTIDLSPSFMPIKNQGKSAACAAFAATSIMEYMLNQTRGKVALSEEMSDLFLWYLFKKDKTANEGTIMSDIPNTEPHIMTSYERFWPWAPVEDEVPTKFAVEPNARAITDAEKKTVKKVGALDPLDPDRWVDALKQRVPVLIAIKVDEGFIKAGATKWYGVTEGNVFGGHAMVIVGYTNQYPDPKDPKKAVHAFKLRNSWGADWGENGYVWVHRDVLAQMLIAVPLVFVGLDLQGAPSDEEEKVEEEKKKEEQEMEEEEQKQEKDLFRKLKGELDSLLEKVAGQKQSLSDLQTEVLLTMREDNNIKQTFEVMKNWLKEYTIAKRKFKEINSTDPSYTVQKENFLSFFKGFKNEIEKELRDLMQDLKLEAQTEQKEARTMSRLLETDAQMQEILEHIEVLGQGLFDSVNGSGNTDNSIVKHATELHNLYEALINIKEQLQQEDIGIKAVVQAVEKKQEIEKTLKRIIEDAKQIIGQSNAEDDINKEINMEQSIANINGFLETNVERLQEQDGNLVRLVQQIVEIVQTKVLPIMVKVETEAKAIGEDILKDQSFFEKLVKKFKPKRRLFD